MAATDITIPLRRIEEETPYLRELPNEVQSWFKTHHIKPKPALLALDTEGKREELFWLITDHTGCDDSSFRVFYDEDKDRFGRECLLESDVPLMLGTYPSLRDALEDIL